MPVVPGYKPSFDPSCLAFPSFKETFDRAFEIIGMLCTYKVHAKRRLKIFSIIYIYIYGQGFFSQIRLGEGIGDLF